MIIFSHIVCLSIFSQIKFFFTSCPHIYQFAPIKFRKKYYITENMPITLLYLVKGNMTTSAFIIDIDRKSD